LLLQRGSLSSSGELLSDMMMPLRLLLLLLPLLPLLHQPLPLLLLLLLVLQPDQRCLNCC
jgi:hypothetical protein